MDNTYNRGSKDELAGLPPNSTFEFVGEGSANVVYRVHPPQDAKPEVKDYFTKLLLRMPKAGKDVYPYHVHQAFYHDTVAPGLSAGNLVEQRLVRIPLPSHVVPALNAILDERQAREENRRKDWVDAKVEPSPSGDSSYGHGMLIESMAAGPGYLTIEIKPKWLAPSPSAPKDAKRCRICARTAKDGKPNAGDGLGGLCPLRLMGCKADEVKADEVWNKVATAAGLPYSQWLNHQGPFVKWLKDDASALLRRLRQLQTQYDPNGVLSIKDEDDEALDGLQTAMTLRDCTCFVRLPIQNIEKAKVKLADLDKKNGKAKLQYWKDSERELIDGGFYVDAGMATKCLLED